MTLYQQNILVGSILGDGNLALYGRSINAHYREHGGKEQNPYREWKAHQLEMAFVPKQNKVYSRSLPIMTDFYNLFYPGGKKTLTKENVQLLNHPVGLLCLYLDDGSLVIQNYRRSTGIHLFPRIFLYTQSFSKKENEILRDHLQQTFSVRFKLRKTPSGSGYHLGINRRQEVMKLMDLLEPFMAEIPCMGYKLDVKRRLLAEKERLEAKYPNDTIVIDSLAAKPHHYTEGDILQMAQMLKAGYTQASIARALGRSYDGVVDKIRRLRKERADFPR